jgi:hypothetical protein
MAPRAVGRVSSRCACWMHGSSCRATSRRNSVAFVVSNQPARSVNRVWTRHCKLNAQTHATRARNFCEVRSLRPSGVWRAPGSTAEQRRGQSLNGPERGIDAELGFGPYLTKASSPSHHAILWLCCADCFCSASAASDARRVPVEAGGCRVGCSSRVAVLTGPLRLGRRVCGGAVACCCRRRHVQAHSIIASRQPSSC